MLLDALGAFHGQREPPRNLHGYAMEQKMQRESKNREREREAPNRFGSTSSSLREMPFVFFALAFYSPSRGRLALISTPTESNPPRIFLCT